MCPESQARRPCRPMFTLPKEVWFFPTTDGQKATTVPPRDRLDAAFVGDWSLLTSTWWCTCFPRTFSKFL